MPGRCGVLCHGIHCVLAWEATAALHSVFPMKIGPPLANAALKAGTWRRQLPARERRIAMRYED